MSVLAHFGIGESDLVGKGGQSRIYALDGDRVLRVYGAETSPDFPARLYAFYAALDVPSLPFAIPQIVETGVRDGALYAIEKRLPGTPLNIALTHLDAVARRKAVRGYLEASTVLRNIRHPQTLFGDILRSQRIRSQSWPDFLWRRAEQNARMAGASLRADVPELTRAFARYRSLLDELPAVQPLLVHGDYYPANVLTGADGGIAAVIDFSPLTVVGDWRADLVSAVCFMEELADPPCEARDDARTCLKNAMVDPDGDIFLTYRAFHAFVHSGSRVEIPELYRWCVAVLRSLAG